MSTHQNLNFKEIIHQYEAIRQSGVTNMLDRTVVQETAFVMGWNELADLNTKEYAQLLSDYSALMAEHNVDKFSVEMKQQVATIQDLFADPDEEEFEDCEDEW